MSKLEPILNFEILPTYDLRALLVADLSEWKHLEKVPTYIDIKVPATTTPATLIFKKGKVNIFNSSLLKINPTTSRTALTKLPDGIYTIKIYPCEGTSFCFERAYLRTVHTQFQLDESWIKMNLDSCQVDKSIIKKHHQAENLLMAAHAHVRDGNLVEGAAHLEAAKGLLEEILECDDCN